MTGKLERVIEALGRLQGDPVVIEQLAATIFWHMTMLKARQGLAKSSGPAKQLRDLERAARKAANGDAWDATWAAVPEKIRSRIWRPKAPPVVSRKFAAAGRLVSFEREPLPGIRAFEAPGQHKLVPTPQHVLAAIAAERERIKQTAGCERRKRKRDELEAAAIKAMRAAFHELTRKKGARAIDANKKLTGRFHRLGLEVDRIFSTQLFAAKDSRRLRDSLGDNRP